MAIMKWHGRKVMSKFQSNARRNVRDAAILVEGVAKGLMRLGGRTKSGEITEGERPGKVGSFASKPGEPPRVQTGTLRRSITHEVHPVLAIARVGTNVIYGKFLELGTGRIAPRPFMRPALHGSQAGIKKIMARRHK